MRNKLLLATILCVSILSSITNKSYASHAAGAEIIYVHISDSTYQFFFKFYRDCTGIDEPDSTDLCFYNTCTNQSFTVKLKKWMGTLPDGRTNGSPVSAGCSQWPTKCESDTSQIPGYEEWWYMCIATLPLKCNYWRFGVAENARNNNQNNIVSGTLYVETTFNSSQTWNNSSPFYSVRPISYVCLNQPYTYNNGAIDPDGDSLWSQMVQPLASGSCTANPHLLAQTRPQGGNPPINFTTNPLPANNSFNLNGGSGQMSFTANVLGPSTLTIKTREYRKINNTVHELGSIMRDVQIQVLTCNNPPPALDSIILITPGNVISNQVYGCVGTSLEFCFAIKSTDTSSVLIVNDNLNTAIPDASITYSFTGTDSVQGCFKWTPKTADAGKNHSFIIIIKDSTCKPPGILLQYTKVLDIFVWGPIQATPDTSICKGEPAFLGVIGGGNYEWTILSGTPNSLSNPNTQNPVATPSATTVYEVTSKANDYCPSLNKDTVTIEVMKGPDMTGQPDVLTCPNFEVQLNLGIVKQPNANYTIKWSPAAGLSSDIVEDPKVKNKATQTYQVEVGSNVNRCKTLDTVLVDVLTGLSIENPDTQICLGQKVDIRGTGDARYNFEWLSPSDNAPSYSNPGGIVTSITPGDTGMHIYVLHATKVPECPGVDSMVDIKIDVQPNPTAQVNNDESLCYGDTLQLTAIVTPNTFNRYTYSWTPGAALDFPDRKDPIFSAVDEGITTLTFVARTPAGCADSDQVTLNVYAATFITLPGDTAICPGDTVTIGMSVNPGVKFYWLPDYNISSVSAVQPRVWPVADQAYTVYATDSFGCLDTNNIQITVRPRAIIELADTARIYPGENYRMDPGGNCLYYTWFPPLGLSNADVSNPTVSPKVNTRYIVHGRTETGCSAIDSIDVLVNTDAILTLPNAFTPGKRNNGTFKIVRRGTAELKRFAVYSRWGTKVFETTDINEGWDGTYQGKPQPVGVFVYTIEAITPSGQTINKQGNVTLIR